MLLPMTARSATRGIPSINRPRYPGRQGGEVMAAAQEDVEARTVYHANPYAEQSALLFGIFFLLVLLLVPLVGVFVEYRKSGDISPTWVGVLVVLGVLIAAAVLRSSRRPPPRSLAVSPRGLEYQGRSRFITASWDDVLRLDSGDDPALVVRPSPSLADGTPRRKHATERISLVPFDFHPDSPLAQQLRRYAPHLF
jgi:hypothetical protein